MTWSPTRQSRPDADRGAPSSSSGPSSTTAAGHLEARNVGGARRRRISAFALHHIGTIDAGRRDVNPDLAGRRSRRQPLAKAQDLRTAESLSFHNAHRSPEHTILYRTRHGMHVEAASRAPGGRRTRLHFPTWVDDDGAPHAVDDIAVVGADPVAAPPARTRHIVAAGPGDLPAGTSVAGLIETGIPAVTSDRFDASGAGVGVGSEDWRVRRILDGDDVPDRRSRGDQSPAARHGDRAAGRWGFGARLDHGIRQRCRREHAWHARRARPVADRPTRARSRRRRDGAPGLGAGGRPRRRPSRPSARSATSGVVQRPVTRASAPWSAVPLRPSLDTSRVNAVGADAVARPATRPHWSSHPARTRKFARWSWPRARRTRPTGGWPSATRHGRTIGWASRRSPGSAAEPDRLGPAGLGRLSARAPRRWRLARRWRAIDSVIDGAVLPLLLQPAGTTSSLRGGAMSGGRRRTGRHHWRIGATIEHACHATGLAGRARRRRNGERRGRARLDLRRRRQTVDVATAGGSVYVADTDDDRPTSDARRQHPVRDRCTRRTVGTRRLLDGRLSARRSRTARWRPEAGVSVFAAHRASGGPLAPLALALGDPASPSGRVYRWTDVNRDGTRQPGEYAHPRRAGGPRRVGRGRDGNRRRALRRPRHTEGVFGLAVDRTRWTAAITGIVRRQTDCCRSSTTARHTRRWPVADEGLNYPFPPAGVFDAFSRDRLEFGLDQYRLDTIALV